ncbi:hypothetical protein LEMLEM_LOCUS5695, partial [Lemmus lemmus]
MTQKQGMPTPGPRSQPGPHHHETDLQYIALPSGTSGSRDQLQMCPGLSSSWWVPSTV